MKVCPVCSESFEDELRFCEFDGTKLVRSRDSSGPREQSREQSKVWSLLGIGLLLGALAISATTIVFMPTSPVLPTVVSVESTTATTPSQPESAPPVVAQVRPPDSAEAASDTVETAPPLEGRKKDNALAAGDSASTAPSPNPKAAAGASDDGSKSEPAKTPAPTNPIAKPNTETPPVNTAKIAAGESASKTTSTSPDPKKDDKRQAASAAQNDKDSKKKPDDKEKKKGGGFLRVFKKIFGKD
ncbi:MAG TPA: hypothetical protein VJH03_20045 [Blastocatellia bacterium]|nr:hypothetical protein [Blastocatellia bacterium]